MTRLIEAGWHGFTVHGCMALDCIRSDIPHQAKVSDEAVFDSVAQHAVCGGKLMNQAPGGSPTLNQHRGGHAVPPTRGPRSA
jgi:hypothetical protein